MADGSYNMQFRIYGAASGGTALWTETRETSNRVQVTNGLFSVQLGQVNPLSASLFDATNLYFEITMATPGTATCATASCATWESPMTPRNKLATSAYAFNAAMLNGKTAADFATASGSANYIQNTTSPQTASFNVTGSGAVGTTMTVGSTTGNNYSLARNLNTGRGTNSSFVVSSGDGGSNRAAFYVRGGLAGNSFEAGSTSIWSAKVTTTASNVGLIVQGSASQSADLFQTRDSADTVTFAVKSDGATRIGGTAAVDNPTARLQVYAGSAGNKGAVVQGAASQTASLLEIQNAAGTSGLTVAASGALTARNFTNSSTAFQIQNASATSFFTANTSNSTIVIGSGANTITLGATGVAFAGSAQPSSTVTLNAEYAGATFVGDGSNNTGSLSSDFCSGSSRMNINASACGATTTRNYYQWTTTEASAQDYDVYVRYQIPSDYASGSMANLRILGWGSTTASEQVSVALYTDASGTACATSGNAVTANATWSSVTIASPLGSCTVVAGDTVTFKVRVQAGQDNFARAGAISFNYKETR